MGLFFYTKIGSIISIGDLPTTNIIEPLFLKVRKLMVIEVLKPQANYYHLGCFDDNLRKSNLFLEINAKL